MILHHYSSLKNSCFINHPRFEIKFVKSQSLHRNINFINLIP